MSSTRSVKPPKGSAKVRLMAMVRLQQEVRLHGMVHHHARVQRLSKARCTAPRSVVLSGRGDHELRVGTKNIQFRQETSEIRAFEVWNSRERGFTKIVERGLWLK
ncbi:hypothetical protein E3N88_39681 [Mikania micrantha]|uniref:Uncharacterized protein n=1 Tax=Mikania micrantha TaxID=192012 RepID=A0A5N6LKJ7_9ASTR|nr:hypothetical protein E3N88_39681 [Mikania micrantha]